MNGNIPKATWKAPALEISTIHMDTELGGIASYDGLEGS
jgi:hypothetical protein